MSPADVLLDLYGRISTTADRLLADIDPVVLHWRPDAEANPIAWLVWHAARVEDDHVADVAGTPQVWHADGWAERFGLDLDTDDTGYGHTAEQVAAVEVDDPALLRRYLEAVQHRSRQFIGQLSPADLDEVVDTSWDPPVTLGVRLVSVADDALQHLGQAAYVRGVAERRR